VNRKDAETLMIYFRINQDHI